MNPRCKSCGDWLMVFRPILRQSVDALEEELACSSCVNMLYLAQAKYQSGSRKHTSRSQVAVLSEFVIDPVGRA